MREEWSLVSRPAKEEPFPPINTMIGHKSNRLTSMGLNNYGKLAYRYGLEDTDYDEDGNEVFREMDSTFFCRVRDLFSAELKTMFNTLESKNAWHAESFLNQIEAWQNQFPEELWRLDIERKYIRTYTSTHINGEGDSQFLVNMANGKMKYPVKQWERSQEKYMASKYQSSLAANDNAVLRCATPEGTLVVPRNYRLKLTPYDYVYLNVAYGTTSPIQLRAEPNITYEIPFTGDSTDIISIYSASCLRSLGDLSTCYPATVDTIRATRIKELIVGNETEGYDNPYFTTLSLGANPLLEVLNLENVSGLTQSLELSLLTNLKELYAHGTNSKGVVFANAGKIEIAELPAITSMTMKNLIYLTTLDVVSFDNLTDLIVENCSTVDLITILDAAPNLNRVRILGVDWNLEDTELLERLYNTKGIDSLGYNLDRAVLSGYVYVHTIKQKPYEDYKEAWPDLTIDYYQMIEQTTATFVNYNNDLIETQYVEKGLAAVDPTKRTENPIATPVQPPTIEHEFKFIGWTDSATGQLVTTFPGIHNPVTYIATYSSSVRNYTVTYASEFHGTIEQHTAPYGSIVEYEGEIPVYTNTEGQAGGYKYHLFDHWDKSGYVDGDKIINAVFDTCTYTGPSYFAGREFNDLRPVEKYMFLRLVASKDIPTSTIENYIQPNDILEFTMGEDYDFDNIESKLLIKDAKYLDTEESAVFTGTNRINTGISLMDEDRSFVLAIDFEFASGNTTGNTLAQCYDFGQSEGFKLSYNGSAPTLNWAGSNNGSTSASIGTNREMIVIRHVAGDTNLYVYKSNLTGMSIEYTTIAHHRTYNTSFNSPLIFGCALNLINDEEAYAKGTIHWAKLWYGDLGDNICRNLAKYTKEKVTTEMCGINRKMLADRSGYGTLSFLAMHTLRNKRKMLNITAPNTTAGGWGASVAREWLNTRFYNGLPLWMRQLVKLVRVDYAEGGSSSNIGSCDCHIFLPSATSLSNETVYASSPYTNEESVIIGDKCISYMRNEDDRVRMDYTGTAVEYWTRSVYQQSPSYFAKVKADGALSAFTSQGAELGLVIEFCM